MTTRTEMREMHPESTGEVDRRDFLPPGRELLIETVVLAPREIASAHRHDAGVFAGALTGSIITRVEVVNPRQSTPAKNFTNHLRISTSRVAMRVPRNPQLVSSFL